MTLTIHGIRNCDTMKRARAWLDEHGVSCAFHDYKTDGIDRVTLERWCRKAGWESLLNRAGTTFRKLPEPARAGLDERRAIELMLGQPSMIKRPVLEGPGHLLVGFNPAAYSAALQPSVQQEK
jgi:Spx/MgsR family transcriptional regulator